MKVKVVIVMFVVALVAAATFLVIQGKGSTDHTYSLRQEWIPWMGYTGEIVAESKGMFGPGFQLDIRPGGLEADPIKLVAGGTDDFGVAGIERVLTAVEKGADLVIVGTVNHRSPTVFLTLETSGIDEANDFAGKRVGVLSGSNTEIVYRALAAKLGLTGSVQEVEISYDLPGFINGKFDVLPAFAYDEPITLQKQGVAFNVIDPVEYDVRAIGNVYFTRREMVDKKPEVVQAFISGVLKGWKFTFQHPDEAIALLGQFDEKLDLEKERESLLAAHPYFENSDRRLLAIYADDVQGEIELLRQIGELQSPIDIDRVLETRFVERAYRD